jgi:hypothetical protein
MTCRDMQSHITDTLVTKNQKIGALSTEWTYMIQPSLRPHVVGMGQVGLQIICPDWCGILSVQYMAEQLRYR